MSHHVPRRDRWQRLSPNEYKSTCGVVRHEKGAWWALLTYRLCLPPAEGEALLEWEEHAERLGPFKRPRNAMIAAEEQALFLQRRHGERMELL